MELTMILAIGELILKHGVPAAINIVKAWNADTNNITLEDITNLRNMVPPPNSFFENKD